VKDTSLIALEDSGDAAWDSVANAADAVADAGDMGVAFVLALAFAGSGDTVWID
jgi:hypothetical protein